MDKHQRETYKKDLIRLSKQITQQIDLQFKKNTVRITSNSNEVLLSYPKAAVYLRKLKAGNSTQTSYYG